MMKLRLNLTAEQFRRKSFDVDKILPDGCTRRHIIDNGQRREILPVLLTHSGQTITLQDGDWILTLSGNRGTVARMLLTHSELCDVVSSGDVMAST